MCDGICHSFIRSIAGTPNLYLLRATAVALA